MGKRVVRGRENLGMTFGVRGAIKGFSRGWKGRNSCGLGGFQARPFVAGVVAMLRMHPALEKTYLFRIPLR